MQYETTVHVFKNSKGEKFHLQLAIPPRYEESVQKAREAAIPVLFCVHGAGMSGDNFLRLARHMSHFPQRPMDADGGAAAADSTTTIGNYALPGHQMISRRTSQLSTTGEMPPPPPLPLTRPPPQPPLSSPPPSPSTPSPSTNATPHPPHVSSAALAAAAAAGVHPHSASGRPPLPQTTTRPTLLPTALHQRHSAVDLVGVGAVAPMPTPLVVVGGEVLRSPMSTSTSAGPSSLGGSGSCCGGGGAGGAGGAAVDGMLGGLTPRSSGSFSETSEVEVCTVMYDLRCHGKSNFVGGEAGLTLPVLVEDFVDVLSHVAEELFPTSLVFVLGHSLGAAIVAAGLSSDPAPSGAHSTTMTKTGSTLRNNGGGNTTTTMTNKNQNNNRHTNGGTNVPPDPTACGEASAPNPSCSTKPPKRAVPKQVVGVVLLDAVEGTAKLSVQHMKTFLSTRPIEFAEVREAEQWFLQQGGMRTADGAHTSVPPLLMPNPSGSGSFVWRSNLEAMESVWNGWFDGLDANFLSIPLPKMLCVASVERLDKALTVGHMQGKFQLEVCGHQSGHYIQDDMPGALAAKLRRFIKRTQDVQKVLRGGVFIGGVPAAAAPAAHTTS